MDNFKYIPHVAAGFFASVAVASLFQSPNWGEAKAGPRGVEIAALGPRQAAAPQIPTAAPRTNAPEASAATAPSEAEICLAEVIYYEARGESVLGQRAVADVVIARAKRSWRGKSRICETAHDTAGDGFQFEGMSRAGEAKADAQAWATAQRIAREQLRGKPVIAADHFWGKRGGVSACERVPAWVDRSKMRPISCIGGHYFWRHN